MSPEYARKLLLAEGLGIDGIVVTVRMGRDPGEERLRRVRDAIDVVSEHTKDDERLDRELTLAMWCIGYGGETQSLSWQKEEAWRDGEFLAQIWEINEKVELYLLGSMDVPDGKYDEMPEGP